MSSEKKTEPMPVDACGMKGPGAEHKTLERFAGTFRAEVRLWFQPGAPPNVSTGTMKNTMVLGGRFLQQEYRDDAGAFEGRGFWGYNDVDRRYEGFWIDVMANFFQIEHGQLDAGGSVYTMIGTMTDPQTGGTMRKRSVIRYTNPDEHSVEMFFQHGGRPESKAMEIRYRRASP
ncbi:MAG: hypothetical protein BroJett003_00050 [Planctomycetota bacterium]|nr:MAG: hypothetical protein BroJett003_00050 [Planctomycetota bacterium]